MDSSHSSDFVQARGMTVALPTSYATYVDRWAIVVGISKYKHKSLNLEYADRDAESLYKLLLTPSGGGFEADHMEKLVNETATTANITKALRSFLKKPAKEDIVLIYFACHGQPDPDRPDILYLLTHDTEPEDIAGTALPMRELTLSLEENLLAERVIMLADTCHSGGIHEAGARNVEDDSGAINRYLQEASTTSTGLALLTSAEANQVSLEHEKWGGGHGVFTHFILEGMRGAADRQPKNGVVTVGELFEYVRENVKRATGNKQHPCIGSNSYDRNLPVAITAGISAHEHYELGCQLYQLGRRLNALTLIESASHHLRESIRLSKGIKHDFSQAYLQLGLAYLSKNDLDSAATAFKHVNSDDVPDASYYLGMTYAKQGKIDEAIRTLALSRNRATSKKSAWINEIIAWLQADKNSKRYALLIGADTYEDGRIRNLKGPANDVKILGQVLSDKYEFECTTLSGKTATYQNVVDEFSRLRALTQPATTVVVAYCGYGEYLESHKEDFKSTGWILYDSRIEENAIRNSIEQEELWDFLKSVPSFHKTLILDCLGRQSLSLTMAMAGEEGLSLFSSTLPDQVSYELPAKSLINHLAHEEVFLFDYEEESHYGVFTFELVKELWSVSEESFQSEIFSAVKGSVQSIFPTQSPSFVGNPRLEIFSGLNLIDLFDLGLRQNYSSLSNDELEQYYKSTCQDVAEIPNEIYQSFGAAFLSKEKYWNATTVFNRLASSGKEIEPETYLVQSIAQLYAQSYEDFSDSLEKYTKTADSSQTREELKKISDKALQLQHSTPYALLVGVRHYINPELPAVAGANNDVAAFKEVLIELCGFHESNITILLNEEATSLAIIDEFTKIVEKSHTNPALFYFSGAGSWSVKKHPTVLSVDSRTKTNNETEVFDIGLIELGQIANAKPNNLISIIDAGWETYEKRRSCPSDSRPGPNTRKATVVIDYDSRELDIFSLKIGSLTLYQESIQFKRTRSDAEVEAELTALHGNQQKKIYGLLTYALVKALKTQALATGNANHLTYAQIFEEMTASLESYGAGSQFVIIGNDHQRIFSHPLQHRELQLTIDKVRKQPFTQIVPILRRLIEQRNGFDPDGYLSLGLIYYFLKQNDKSIQAISSAIEQVTGNHLSEEASTQERNMFPEAHYWLGRILYESKSDLERAVSELKLAIQQAPENTAAYYYLGQALRMLVEQEILQTAADAFTTYLNGGAPLGNKDEVQAFLKSRSQPIQA